MKSLSTDPLSIDVYAAPMRPYIPYGSRPEPKSLARA
jgi:hypothetical protein